MPTDNPLEETLRLARDLCLGVGAFFVTPAGTVFSNVSDVMRPDDAERRVAALARNCLTHPSARGETLFWSAEAAEDGGAPAESSLACVVAPVRSGHDWLGLLGVVDVWLPELDEEQRAGLMALARGLGTRPPATTPEDRDRLTTEVASQPERGIPPSGAGEGATQPDPGSAEPFLGEILDHLPDGLVVTRADGTIVLVNQTFAAMTGLTLDAVLGEDVEAVVDVGFAGDVRTVDSTGTAATPDDRPSRLERALASAEPGRVLAVGGTVGPPVDVTAAGRRIESRFAGECFVTLIRPAGAEGAERPPLAGHVGVQELLDHIEDGIVCCDAAGMVVLANRAAKRLSGLTDDQLLVGEPFPSVTRLRTADGEPIAADAHPLLRSMRENVAVLTYVELDEGDATVNVAISARPLRVDGGDGAIAVLRDVTAEQQRQADLTHYALHDSLTGVANRYLLMDALGRMLDGLTRRGGFVSLIYLDLDRFKAINDEHGHETGDAVLQAVAHRLERAVRGEDVVARLGGDEFVVAHVTADRLSDGDAVVARLRKVLTAPYRFGDLVLDVGASVGWVSTSSGGDTPEGLISRADRAMYEHKRLRRAQEQEDVA